MKSIISIALQHCNDLRIGRGAIPEGFVCGEGGRMRGFLLPLLVAAVVVLVLFLNQILFPK
jgi:hypothetical protein